MEFKLTLLIQNICVFKRISNIFLEYSNSFKIRIINVRRNTKMARMLEVQAGESRWRRWEGKMDEQADVHPRVHRISCWTRKFLEVPLFDLQVWWSIFLLPLPSMLILYGYPTVADGVITRLENPKRRYLCVQRYSP